jgi:RNA polymerase sigma factor (sigma-70 family)
VTGQELSSETVADLAIIRACRFEKGEANWEQFFRRFGERFRRWLRNALRDSGDADREDAYQNLAAELLDGHILEKIDLARDPNPYLHRCVKNFAWKYYLSCRRHAVEPIGNEEKLADRLALVADQAAPMPEDQLFLRLNEKLRSSRVSEKKLRTFQILLQNKTLREIAEETGFSTSAVDRYVDELEAICYEALGVPLPPRKKKSRSHGKIAPRPDRDE